MQTVWPADKLHKPGGVQVGLLLAQQAGGWLLHPRPQALLPRLLAVRAASEGPTQSHPGSLHRSPHPGHAPHDGPGGVEEQTQRGDCVVRARGWPGWSYTSPPKLQHIHSQWPKHLSFWVSVFCAKGLHLDQNDFIIDLEEEPDGMNKKNTNYLMWWQWWLNALIPMQRPFVPTRIQILLLAYRALNWAPESEWLVENNIIYIIYIHTRKIKKLISWQKLLQRMLDVVKIHRCWSSSVGFTLLDTSDFCSGNPGTRYQIWCEHAYTVNICISEWTVRMCL